jgi:hypothetical protein
MTTCPAAASPQARPPTDYASLNCVFRTRVNTGGPHQRDCDGLISALRGFVT